MDDQNDRISDQRRRFLGSALAVGATALLVSHAGAQDKKPAPPPAGPKTDAGPRRAAAASDAGTAPASDAGAATAPTLTQPALPYAQNALEPAISGTTLSFHYGKHHKTYYEKTNTLIEGTPFKNKSLEEIVRGAAKGKQHQKLFNNAAQAWNHDFYWQSMMPKGGGAPPATLAERINKDFGSYDAFKTQFTQTAVDHFSNGWVWLVLDKGKLKIVDTHDADNPVVKGMKPLLVSDVWEHAYYLDYKNARKDYVTAFLDKLVNWGFVEQNLAKG